MIKFLSLDNIIKIHNIIIKEFGGLQGNSERLELFESSIQHIKNNDYYPHFHEKIAHLMFCCIKFHPFIDGNKRTSIAIAKIFMQINNYFCMQKIEVQLENIAVFIAENTFSEKQLADFFKENLQKNKNK